MPSFQYSVVDAFTQIPFKGNPAAVIILPVDSQHGDELLQAVAAEFNLTETAYAKPINKEKGLFHLRWFAPKAEVNLCGHATLATARVLFSNRVLIGLPDNLDRLEFQTKNSGILVAKMLEDGRIELELPAGQVRPIDSSQVRDRISAAVNAAFHPDPPQTTFLGDGNKSYSDYLLIEINSDYDLERHKIQTDSLESLAPTYKLIVIAQRAITSNGEDFKSRVFAPAVGVPEDPVCGSGHSFIAPYWHKALGKGQGAELRSKQVSLRSGEIGMVVEGTRCKLRGYATLVATGELFYP